jgi:hypothetical protein
MVKNDELLTNNGALAVYETIYPLCIDPARFKGTKPTFVYFSEEKVAVKTWREVYTLILQRSAARAEIFENLMYLRGKISGRKRVILSGKPNGMNVPVKIADELFAEGFFDTEWLIKVLTVDILDAAHYDYSDISVSVVAGKKSLRRAITRIKGSS